MTGRAVKVQVDFAVMGCFANEAPEGQLTDDLRALLVIASDLAEGNGSRPVTVRLLHASGRIETLPGGPQWAEITKTRI